MKGLKQRLKKPPANGNFPKDAAWTRHNQRIWHAVASNQPAKVSAKLSKHPDVDVNTIFPDVGYSVVHYAAAKGRDDCLNILLAYKADASSCDITGATPLHAAARYGHKGTTSKLLASRSIKVNLSDKNQCTALHFAAFEGHVECVKVIADAPDVNLNCKDKDGRTLLMIAAAMGHTDICKELLKRECDLRHQDIALGHTALTLAADSGHADVVQLLIDSGADLDQALHDGRTALDLAKQKERSDVVAVLLAVQRPTGTKSKFSNGPRPGTSSSSRHRLADPAVKKRHSYDGILETESTYIDDLVAGTHRSTGSRTPKPPRRTKEEKKATKSNLSKVKAAFGTKMKSNSRRGSDASGRSANSTPRQKKKKDAPAVPTDVNVALSMYTKESPKFYEKEHLRFYDSNSSLDVSSMCSAPNNISKSMDSLRPMLEESDGASVDQNLAPKVVEGTDFSKRRKDEELARLQKMNNDYAKKIRELEEELSRASEVSMATEKLQKNAEEIRSAQFSDAKEEFERKESKMTREIEDLKQISVNFKRQSEDHRQKLHALQKTSHALEKQVKQHEEGSVKLRGENGVLLEKVELLQEENAKMKLKIAKGKENQSAIIDQAKQKIMEAEQRCNQVELASGEAEEKLQAAESRATEEEQRCRALESKLDEAELSLAEAEQTRKELEEKCAQTEGEIDEAEQQREDVEMKLGEVTKDKRKVERELKKMKEELATGKTELQKHKTELDDLATLLLAAGFSPGDRGQGGEEETDIFQNLKTDVQTLVQRLQAEEDQLSSNEARNKDLEEKLNTSINEKNKKIDELEKQIKDSQDELTRKAMECSRLNSELEQIKDQYKSLKAEKKKMEEEHVSEKSKNRGDLATQASELTRCRDEVAELRHKLDDALDALEKQREETIPRDAYEADCQKIRTDADLLKKEVAKTIEKFTMVQMELTNKEKELSDLRVERNQSEAKSSGYEAEVLQLKSKCDETEVQVNILRQQLTEMKNKLQKATEEVNSLRKLRRDMTIRLSAKQGEINDAEKKTVEGLKKQLESLSSHIQESEKRYRDTTAIYRGHLLAAITGRLDTDVQQALHEIVKLHGTEDEKEFVSHQSH